MNRHILLPLLAAVPAVGAAASNDRPNVLIIHTDEHNFRTLGCYRQLMPRAQAEVWGDGVVVETPNIDYLAKNGVICNRFYASTPVSSPSRSSFMTGLFPQQTDVVTNNIPMNDRVVTFAEDFSRAGYHTGYIGKWHLDGPDRPGWCPERKFGFRDNEFMVNRGHYKRIEKTDEGYDITYDGKDLREDNFFTDFLTDKAVKYIRDHKSENFCCVVAYPDPHGPNVVRPPYDTMYSHFKFQKPATASKEMKGVPTWARGNGHMEDMARYFGMIKCIDDNIGVILDELRRQDLLDKTIIIFTSDHGDLCGEHGRVNKGVPLEASAKVPFVISYPAGLPSGKVVDEVLSVVDFAPTILSLAGVETHAERAGRNFAPLLKGRKAGRKWHDAVFVRGTDNGIDHKSWLTVVTRDYKLTLSEEEVNRPWLTDMNNDPDELVNCYDDPRYADVVKRLLGELEEYGRKWNDKRIDWPNIRKEIDKR